MRCYIGGLSNGEKTRDLVCFLFDVLGFGTHGKYFCKKRTRLESPALDVFTTE